MYKVCYNADLIRFQTEINMMLREGWVLTGGVSVCYNGVGLIYYQAMVYPLDSNES